MLSSGKAPSLTGCMSSKELVRAGSAFDVSNIIELGKKALRRALLTDGHLRGKVMHTLLLP